MQLQDWLKRQQKLHPKNIDLGLDRIRQVWQRLAPADALQAMTIISIAGTNGKGSCLALLEQIYHQAGYSVLSYRSPHLIRYNERIQYQGRPLSDERIVQAFEAIEAARQNTSLTYFEFGTLAALYWAWQYQPQVLILEVGLGGRLDAVNLVDADLALITSIGLDHQDYLGSDLERIGYEKAGIMRPHKPAIFAAEAMPASIERHAAALQAPLYRPRQHYDWQILDQHWCWQGQGQILELPFPALPGQHQFYNAAAVLMAVHLLPLPVDQPAMARALQQVRLAGRLQIHQQGDQIYLFDVAHNLEAAQMLKKYLQGRYTAIFSMLADKPIAEVSALLDHHVRAWHLIPVPDHRALEPRILKSKMKVQSPIYCHQHVSSALQAVQDDRILVFGSFYTVAAVQSALGLL